MTLIGRAGAQRCGAYLAVILAAAFLSLASAFPCQAWSENLLLNPGFEAGDSCWGGYAYWETPDPSSLPSGENSALPPSVRLLTDLFLRPTRLSNDTGR